MFTNCIKNVCLNLLNAELNPIRHLLSLVGARHIVYVSRVRVNYAFIMKRIVRDFRLSQLCE